MEEKEVAQLTETYIELLGVKNGTRLMNYFLGRGNDHEDKMVWMNLFVKQKFKMKRVHKYLEGTYDIKKSWMKELEYLKSLDICNPDTVKHIKENIIDCENDIQKYKDVLIHQWEYMDRNLFPYLSKFITDDEFASLIGTNVNRVREARKSYDKGNRAKRGSGNFLTDAIAVYRVEAEGAYGTFATAFNECMFKMYDENKEFRDAMNNKIGDMMFEAGIPTYNAVIDGQGNIVGMKQVPFKPRLVN